MTDYGVTVRNLFDVLAEDSKPEPAPKKEEKKPAAPAQKPNQAKTQPKKPAATTTKPAAKVDASSQSSTQKGPKMDREKQNFIQKKKFQTEGNLKRDKSSDRQSDTPKRNQDSKKGGAGSHNWGKTKVTEQDVTQEELNFVPTKPEKLIKEDVSEEVINAKKEGDQESDQPAATITVEPLSSEKKEEAKEGGEGGESASAKKKKKKRNRKGKKGKKEEEKKEEEGPKLKDEDMVLFDEYQKTLAVKKPVAQLKVRKAGEGIEENPDWKDAVVLKKAEDDDAALTVNPNSYKK